MKKIATKKRIISDSRKVEKGDVFVAFAENVEERNRHILQASKLGASTIITDIPNPLASKIVKDAKSTFIMMSLEYHNIQKLEIPVLGVTGTDGKSTTTHIAWHCLGKTAARIGTLGFYDGKKEIETDYTTPPSEKIHSFLSSLDRNCTGVAMEISSHAAAQKRVDGIKLDGLVWTGLTSDHLDYHKTVENYFLAKLEIIKQLKPGALCVVAAHDPRLYRIKKAIEKVGARCVTLGKKDADIRLEKNNDGIWRAYSAYTEYALPNILPGEYNYWNMMAGALLAHSSGKVSLSDAVKRLHSLPVVPGRMEKVSEKPLCYIDFAHTPKALELSIQALKDENKKVICVFGCGGDRDKSKRPVMGNIASKLATTVIVTSDNSRNEKPIDIINQIVGEKNMIKEPIRSKAIERAIDLADKESVVLIAGKGHEKYQDENGEKKPWDDKEFVLFLLQERK